MIKTKFVFAVSFVAMMAVGTGHAEIAGVSYVEEQVGVATTAANNAQTSANAANAAAGNAQTSADNAQDAADAAQESADAAAASAKAANDAVALKQDKLTAAQLDAANSGITSAKVSTYDGYAATIAGKQDKLGYTAENTANKATSFDDTTASDTKYPSTSAVKSYVSAATSTINTTIEAVQTAVAGKQATLTTTQLAAVNSGITSTKVSTYDGYAATIAGKQATISDLATIRSGAEAGATAVQPNDLAKVATTGSYNDLTNKPTIPSGALASKSTITNADVADDAEIAQSKISGLTTALSGKQATLTAAQLDAVNSGITSAKVSTYDGYAATIAGKQATISDLATIRSGAAAGATAVQPDALAAVATTGSYNDLTDKPTIPSGALASKSTITNADVADDAEIAQSKISGLTTALSGKQATLTAAQLDAVNSGITSAKVSTYDGYAATIAGKQATISDLATIRSGAEAGATAVQPDALAAVATSGSYNDLTNKPTIPSGALASKSTITNADVADDAEIAQSKISGLTTALSGKQATLTAAQLDAVNSGITSAKVGDYDGYAATIAGKQDKMLATEITTAVSGAKDSYYPSVGLMETSITNANDNVMLSVNAKLASVSSSGTGSVVKAVAKDGTAVKATLGYIESSDITDASIATADIANGAVTAAKTTGIYGFIPSGGEGASTTAAIWVE